MQKLSKLILKEKIENLEKYFSDYNNKTSSKKLEEVKQKLDTQEYKIAVVANMSSGKSTFINALFGKDVLPSFEHATTDCATYIYSKPYIDKKVKVYFSDKKKSVELNENIEREIKQYAQKDEDCEDEKYKNVEKIELQHPFKNLQTSSSEDFSITFIDTPGPNSTGDFGQKHKDQTRSVLNSVDMALFVFDYGQLDANLKSDEQGLWNTIKKRHEKDSNFEVYFLINKIDLAMNDNFKEIDTKDKDEFIRLKKENWFKHEAKAIDKLKKAAISHGIKDPKVYPISSSYQLLDRDDNINFDDEDKLESFQKSHFRRLFENWEEEYLKYLGIINLEEDINTYINTSVKEKILQIAFDNMAEVYNDELRVLNERIQIFSQPKEEAQKNIEKALDFLDNKAKILETNMLNKFKKSEEKYKQEIINLISFAIEEELYSKVDEMSKMAIAFVQATAFGSNAKLAEKRAKENYYNISLDKQVKIELTNSINVNDVLKAMQEYMRILFNEYKNNYLDIKTDLKNSYVNYERDIAKIFRQTKESLNSELQDALDIDIQSIEMKTVDIDSTLSFDVSVPDSVLDYKYQDAKYKSVSTSSWWNPFSWGDKESVKTQDEKHTLIINPIELKTSIEKNMSETIEKFSDKEQQNYIDAIISLRRENSDIFQDFRQNKQKEIDKLQDEIKNSEKELEVVERQFENFNNTVKE